MSGGKKQLKIVVFEDDSVIRSLFENLLEVHGYSATTFAEPFSCPLYEDSHCSCTQSTPCADVIIADIRMPYMSGDEFFRAQLERGCKAPAGNRALMTAALTPERKALAEELGCHIITKPFKMAEISAWLEECAQRSFGTTQDLAV